MSAPEKANQPDFAGCEPCNSGPLASLNGKPCRT